MAQRDRYKVVLNATMIINGERLDRGEHSITEAEAEYFLTTTHRVSKNGKELPRRPAEEDEAKNQKLLSVFGTDEYKARKKFLDGIDKLEKAELEDLVKDLDKAVEKLDPVNQKKGKIHIQKRLDDIITEEERQKELEEKKKQEKAEKAKKAKEEKARKAQEEKEAKEAKAAADKKAKEEKAAAEKKAKEDKKAEEQKQKDAEAKKLADEKEAKENADDENVTKTDETPSGDETEPSAEVLEAREKFLKVTGEEVPARRSSDLKYMNEAIAEAEKSQS